uniref:Bromo adjacent homology domain containing 1 n=1 Tax=Sinocyclocheilus rhinocerous TaxID=307959 RepID=A0A673I6W8_9TELE
MTHARQRNSLCGYKSESADQVSCQTTMDRTWPEKKAKRCSTQRGKGKEIKGKAAERDRKLYPLRGRHGLGEVSALNCCVVLTRLDETCKTCRSAPEPKSKVKPDKSALCTEFILEPRQRRLASLNAEAVNSLLLDREDPQQTSNPSRKQQHTKGDTSFSKDTTKDNDCSRKGQDNRKRACTGETEQCRNPKKAKTESDAIDLQTLNSPAPKRLAGLNAAALLKLTSTSSGVKRRGKTDGAVRGKQLQSVEYCHRLALFLGQKTFPETDEHSLKGFIPSPHTLTHPAMPISAHPYPCYPGYYVHIAHHGTPTLPLSSNPGSHVASSVPPLTICTSGVQRPKLLPSSVSHPTGIPHPAYCNSVGTCYGEACRLSSYAYRPTQPITSRGCSYNAGCSSCMHKMETGRMENEMKTTLTPWMTTSRPSQCLRRPQVQIRVGRECPQRAKPPSGSRSGVRDSAVCPHIKDGQLGAGHGSGAAKQSKISRRRATNGWLPVGVATEKEVFIVGEDSTSLRRCYEGVQRDGEVIRVRDTVLLRSGPRKKSLPYVAKVSAFWEDPESGELMMSLFWYYRPEHTQGGRNPSMHCENEIFASRHQDENSVACIEDKCYVLTLAQYCRFCALVKYREEGFPRRSSLVPPSSYVIPAHRCVPNDIDPDLVFVCRHVYDFRFGRLLKNLQ